MEDSTPPIAKLHVLRERVREGFWAVRHLSGSQLSADMLTKPCSSKTQWEQFLRRISMERPAEKVVEQGGSSLKKVLAMVGAMAALAASSVGTERRGLAKGISLAALSACLATQVKAWKSKVPSCDQKMAKIGVRSHPAFREPEPNAPHTRNPTLKVEPGEGERDIRPRVTRNSNEPGREDDGSDVSSRHSIHCSPEGSRHVRTNQVSAMDVEVEGPLREGRLDVLGRRDHLGAEGSILEPLLDSRSTLKAMRASVVEEGIKLMTVEEYEVFKSAPQRVSDAWIKVADEHTLVRVHGKARKGIFQPDHRSLQIPLSKLSEKRTTIAFLPDGKRRVFHDNWHVDQELLWSCPWRGYAIFYIDHAPEEFGGNGSGESSAAAGSQESREDFSAQIEIGYKKGGPLARAKVALGIDLSRAEAHAGVDECGTISCGDLGSFGYGSARDPMKPASSHRVPEGMPAVRTYSGVKFKAPPPCLKEASGSGTPWSATPTPKKAPPPCPPSPTSLEAGPPSPRSSSQGSWSLA